MKKLNKEQKPIADSSPGSVANAPVSGNFPVTKECHCGDTADKYLQRKFINQAKFTVYRVFYRCRNCLSRIHEDFIPELDAKKQINVLDLLLNSR